MKKVLVINEGYSDNFGDQAIKKSIIELLKNENFDCDFIYLSDPRLTSIPIVNYQNFDQNKYKPKSFYEKIKTYLLFFYWYKINKKFIISVLKKENYQKVVIGGGQLIISSGSFSLSSFSIALFWITHLVKKHSKAQIFMVGVGTSKTFNFIEKWLYKRIFKNIEKITVRDPFSKNLLYNLFNVDSLLMPDVAFYNPSYNIGIIHKKNIALLGITNFNEVFKRYNKTAKVSKNEYFELIEEVFLRYNEKYGVIKLFYTTKQDAEECFNFKKFMKLRGKDIMICNLFTLKDLENELESASIVYSGRMHALILAKKLNCEIEVFEISQKLKTFKEEYYDSKVSMIEINQKLERSFPSTIGVR